MPDPKFLKPWHGIPRKEITWHPRVEEDLCMGCGLCVTSCGRQVYEYDAERRKSVVAEPLHCMVGCVTCANLCPEQAISFPPLTTLRRLVKDHKLVQRARKELRQRPAAA